eukprot:601717-Rhodomonas_salina.2
MLLDEQYDHIFEYILKSSPTGDLMERMKWDRMSLLADHSKDYNDKTKMQCANATELTSLHINMAGQIARNTASGAFDSFYASFVEGKAELRTPEQNAIYGILCTKYMKEVSVGKHYSPEWIGTKYYKHPAIIALSESQLKFHFESVTESTNVNLTAKLTAALQTHTDVNINEVAHQFEKVTVIDPIAQAYTTVPAFVDYIKASLQYEVIRRRSKFAGTQNVADALTKSLLAPSFLKHSEYLFGSRIMIPFEAFCVSIGAHRPGPRGRRCSARPSRQLPEFGG